MASSVLTLISAFSFLLIACFASPTSKIVGGDFAEANQFPHQISLLNKGSHNCGGSIINENVVLTAAHCVVDYFNNPYPPSVHTVVAGTNSLVKGGERHTVRKVIAHESYGNFKNDVALLFLTEPLKFSESIQPIELATAEVPDNSDIIISGWGRIYSGGPLSNDLKYNTLFAVPQKDCGKESGIIHNGIICLGHSYDNGACNGDSGGPALYNNTLVGVANFVVSGCGSDYPDGYAKVFYFLDWIQKNIAKNL